MIEDIDLDITPHPPHFSILRLSPPFASLLHDIPYDFSFPRRLLPLLPLFRRSCLCSGRSSCHDAAVQSAAEAMKSLTPPLFRGAADATPSLRPTAAISGRRCR